MPFTCNLCGQSRLQHLKSCPKAFNIIKQKQFNKKAKQEYFGESPNVFVGSFGYPKVNVGFLSNENLPIDSDNPKLWARQNYQIPQIIDLRSNLINSRFSSNVKSFDKKFLDLTKEISMAGKPVEVEVHLEKKPQFNLNIEKDVSPYGPNVNLKKADITENTKITAHVDKVVEDTELKAADALNYLYKKGYEEHFLTKLVSAGNLGMEDKRRLVPTKWSITMTDDTIGKKLISEIKEFNEYDYAAHFGGYLGNYFLILFFPCKWSYELFETYVGDLTNNEIESSSDFEANEGRKNYAGNTAGGYYASRLAALEYLKHKKRQAGVLELRFITDEYYMGIGVWVVRNAARKALNSKPIKFSDQSLLLKYAGSLIKKKFNFDLNLILKKSALINGLKQKTLLSF